MKVKVKVISHLILKDDEENILIFYDFLVKIQTYDQKYKFYSFNLKNLRLLAFLRHSLRE